MARSPKDRVADHAPWLPPSYEEADVYAIQALAKGTANPDQQKRALQWIIEKGCAVYDMSFRPGGEEGARETDFAEGRRFAGNQVVKMTKLKIGQLRREP